MKTHLLVLTVLFQAVGFLSVPDTFAQDLYHFAGSTQCPIYLSKKALLIQFHNRSVIDSLPASRLADKAIGIKVIDGMKGLAYVFFPDGLSKDDFDAGIKSIRSNVNIKSAHPLMTTPEGIEIGGFLDVIIVKLREGADFNLFQLLLKEKGLSINEIDHYDKDIFYLSGQSALNNPIGVCNELYSSKFLDFAQPNSLRYIKPAGTPADPLFASQWGHSKMQFPEAWDITSGCATIKIAIVDNGVQLNHPDLVNNITGGFDATGNGSNGGPVAGETPHGTKCAGIAAALGNNIGIAGAAYSCKIVPVRAYATSGGNLSTDVFIATAINYAASVADVISMSWTILSASHPNIDLAITAAINNATSTGRGNNPGLTHLQVKRTILETCEKVGNYAYVVGNSSKYPDLSHHTEMGHGRANAYKAIEKAAGGPISGPSTICTTGNFVLTSPIPGATITWSTSNAGLSITNGGIATRQGAFNGDVTVMATITVPGSCAAILRKKIYVGIPALMNGYYVSNGLQYGLVESDVSYPNTSCWVSNPTTGSAYTSITGATSASWSKISSTPSALLWSSVSGNLNISFQAIGQQGIFKLMYSNACGSVSKFYGFRSVSCASFIAYPNPASDLVTIEFKSTASREDIPLEINLVSEKSLQIVRNIRMDDIINGNEQHFLNQNKIKVDVSDLPRGTYYLHAVRVRTLI